MTTLERIRTKVRRLTSSPSENQLTMANLDLAINDFYTLDLPAHLQTFNLRDVFTFFTNENVDVYAFPTNTFSSILPPFFVAGYQSDFFQNREQFFRSYTTRAFDEDLVAGDGTVGPFTVLRRGPPTGVTFESKVLISAVDATGTTVIAEDTVVTGDVGTLTGVGVAAGTINYLTGAISITFTNAIPTGNQINTQTVSYVTNRPQACLFYNDQFTIRPVPDKVYKCQIDAYILPTALLLATDSPEVQQWWQFLAAGAAKKLFEERQDNDGIASVMGFYKEQELIVLRRTIMQNAIKRTATIYSEGVSSELGRGEEYGGRW